MAFNPPVITAAYTALVGLLAAFPTVRVIIFRGRFNVDAGDGGQPALAQSIRAHGNLTEQTPTTLSPPADCRSGIGFWAAMLSKTC